ncbi:MAG TPA: sugar ABC transporter substrate-binding protein [bacterium]|nr:sugar ABC transporter substrate-binding protein [bacterium]HQL60820.1 sugar ABC transporter substrate-binding protein [bacterium]
MKRFLIKLLHRLEACATRLLGSSLGGTGILPVCPDFRLLRHPSTRPAGLVLAIILFCGIALCGFSNEADAKSYRIALVMKAVTNPFFHAMEEGAKTEAEKLGVTLLPASVERETDIDRQIGLVEDFIVKQVDAIVIAPASSQGLVPVLKRAQSEGIYVVNIDNPLDKDAMKQQEFTCPFVGSDNQLGACIATHALVAKMGAVGEIAMLEGIPGVTNAELRKAGFLSVIQPVPGIKLVASQTANWETEQAFNVTSNILTAHPNLRGIFCANDNMALGAIAALEAGGKTGEVAVTAYDNLEAAREAILEGKMFATIEQHPERMGAYGVRVAKDHLDGKPVEDYTRTPLDLIDYQYLVKVMGMAGKK